MSMTFNFHRCLCSFIAICNYDIAICDGCQGKVERFFRQGDAPRSSGHLILNVVRGVLKPGIPSLAGLFALFTVAAQGQPAAADVRTFIFHVSNAAAVSNVEASIGYAADWDVSVVLDTVKCDLYCTYRPKRDGFGRGVVLGLLPPIIFIRLDTESGVKPTILVVDPAGLGSPGMTNCAAPSEEYAGLPGRRLQMDFPQEARHDRAGSHAATQAATSQTHGLASTLQFPRALRI